jgi:hypothetical protein
MVKRDLANSACANMGSARSSNSSDQHAALDFVSERTSLHWIAEPQEHQPHRQDREAVISCPAPTASVVTHGLNKQPGGIREGLVEQGGKRDDQKGSG